MSGCRIACAGRCLSLACLCSPAGAETNHQLHVFRPGPCARKETREAVEDWKPVIPKSLERCTKQLLDFNMPAAGESSAYCTLSSRQHQPMSFKVRIPTIYRESQKEGKKERKEGRKEGKKAGRTTHTHTHTHTHPPFCSTLL